MSKETKEILNADGLPLIHASEVRKILGISSSTLSENYLPRLKDKPYPVHGGYHFTQEQVDELIEINKKIGRKG